MEDDIFGLLLKMHRGSFEPGSMSRGHIPGPGSYFVPHLNIVVWARSSFLARGPDTSRPAWITPTFLLLVSVPCFQGTLSLLIKSKSNVSLLFFSYISHVFEDLGERKFYNLIRYTKQPDTSYIRRS